MPGNHSRLAQLFTGYTDHDPAAGILGCRDRNQPARHSVCPNHFHLGAPLWCAPSAGKVLAPVGPGRNITLWRMGRLRNLGKPLFQSGVSWRGRCRNRGYPCWLGCRNPACLRARHANCLGCIHVAARWVLNLWATTNSPPAAIGDIALIIPRCRSAGVCNLTHNWFWGQLWFYCNRILLYDHRRFHDTSHHAFWRRRECWSNNRCTHRWFRDRCTNHAFGCGLSHRLDDRGNGVSHYGRIRYRRLSERRPLPTNLPAAARHPWHPSDIATDARTNENAAFAIDILLASIAAWRKFGWDTRIAQ